MESRRGLLSIKGRMKFFENGYNGGDGKFSLEMEGGKPGMWGGGGGGGGGWGL